MPILQVNFCQGNEIVRAPTKRLLHIHGISGYCLINIDNKYILSVVAYTISEFDCT